MENKVEDRKEPENGLNIVTTIDVVIQKYAEHDLDKEMLNTR